MSKRKPLYQRFGISGGHPHESPGPSERKLYIEDLAYQGDTPLNPPVRVNASFISEMLSEKLSEMPSRMLNEMISEMFDEMHNRMLSRMLDEISCRMSSRILDRMLSEMLDEMLNEMLDEIFSEMLSEFVLIFKVMLLQLFCAPIRSWLGTNGFFTPLNQFYKIE